MRLIALNAGAASHIGKTYEFASPAALDPPEPEWEDEVESSDATFADLLAKAPGPAPHAVVHRVVHAGLDPSIGFEERIDDRIVAAITAGVTFAPGHNKLALEGIRAASARFPDAVQIAVFDRALDDDAPAVATTIPGPSAWGDRGLRRMGFHGISHRDAIERVARALGRDDARVLTVHLGSGCSISAFSGRTLVENTMGLTPLEGLVMGARGGSLDPGLLLYLLGGGGEDLASLSDTLNHEAGLKGMSGISLDTREVDAAIAAGDARARLAMDVYCYRLRQEIGAMAATLGGLDALSFSGPVGEHVAGIRADACAQLAFIGIVLDSERNDALPAEGPVPFSEISGSGARVRTFVVPTLEEWAMCRRAERLLL